MGVWPNRVVREGSHGLLSPLTDTPLADMCLISSNATSQTTGAWTQNRAVYLPVRVHRTLTVTSMLTQVVTQAGNLDAGIYDWAGTQLVANGGVGVGAAGVQQIDIADTTLQPGWYYMAFSCNSATAVFRNCTLATPAGQACGLQQQASAYALPATATFAAYTTGLFPAICAAFNTTL